MRRHKNLYPKIVSFQNLLKAAKLAQRGKRFKDSTARFNFDLEKELWKLHYELATKRYRPGNYHHFTIYEPKERVISAAPYRDRIVHHAIHNILEPIFEPTFIYDSYATRKEKGTHAAINRFQKFARQNSYVLKCDIQKYFPSIAHNILMKLICRKIACQNTLWLINKILESYSMDSNLQPASQPASQPALIGIPIGNLTSQFFANIYLNGLDHFIQEDLKCRHYVRYMDDFVVFHNDKQFLWGIKAQITRYLKDLRLHLHENKCRIFAVKYGAPFLGMLVFPNNRRIKRENVLRFKRKLKHFQALYQNGIISWLHIHQSVQSWIGHASKANTVSLRKFLLENVVFQQRKGD